MKNFTCLIKQTPIAICAGIYALLVLFLPLLKIILSFLMMLLWPLKVLLWLLIGLVTGDLGFPELVETPWLDEIDAKELESIKEEYVNETYFQDNNGDV